MSTSKVLTETSVIPAHKDAVTALEVFDYNNTEVLCSSSRDGRVLARNLRNNNAIIREFSKHSFYVNSMVIAKNANRIITAESDKIGRIFDFNSQKSLVLKGHASDVLCSSVNFLENKIVTGSTDKNIYIWNTQGNLEGVILHSVENGHSGWITCVDFKPSEENEIITGSFDGTIKIWDIEKKKLINTFFEGKLVNDKTVLVNDGTFSVKALNISADGTFCAYGGNNGLVYIIDLNDNEMIASFDTNNTITSLAFGLTESIIACGTQDKIFLWDVPTNELLDTVDLSVYGKNCECMSLTWSGNTLFAGLKNGKIVSFEFFRKK
ncbi:guanine nucleotide-binding subunit beta [Tubulinosema ratisbonensis]|uniref:Guanine nucleotide-binding subunit beta n=1 Tax=Tubulinosema ratisbonensis TaxID=291195 RepID=A0A437AIV4_9MICR|nr:guanine nucleotide-binding subunit beta [Tubulinosema ratisbonensis]